MLWANLKFTTIERMSPLGIVDYGLLTVSGMVLFFCTFVALRSQDCGHPVERIRDYELDDEQELFGG